MSGVEPTELVAGAWQLRPWPSAYADLDEVLAERYAADELATERTRRLEGWATGTFLAFAVREITTGTSVAESVVVREVGAPARVETWLRPTSDANAAGHEHGRSAALPGQAEAAVRRWAAATLEHLD